MIVNGRELADNLLEKIRQEILKRSIKPRLTVIQVGNDTSSTAYIKQKNKNGEKVGIDVIHKHFPNTITQQELISEIRVLNTDNAINGIVVQRPLPSRISSETIVNEVMKEKDVDGFNHDSIFSPPVGLAVFYILSKIYNATNENFSKILKTKNVVIVGRGETAGKPIAQTFTKQGLSCNVIHSKTISPGLIMKSADIIISCVGKQVIHKEDIKKDVILIGVGLSRQDGKLVGDYVENEIKDTASYYTPTPGGIGPLTVAFLLKNVVDSHDN